MTSSKTSVQDRRLAKRVPAKSERLGRGEVGWGEAKEKYSSLFGGSARAAPSFGERREPASYEKREPLVSLVARRNSRLRHPRVAPKESLLAG